MNLRSVTEVVFFFFPIPARSLSLSLRVSEVNTLVLCIIVSVFSSNTHGRQRKPDERESFQFEDVSLACYLFCWRAVFH